MAGSVIERMGTIVEAEFIIHDDRPVEWARADAIAGRRVDRRKRYAIIDGVLCGSIGWSQYCTGCTEIPEMTWVTPAARGCGCSECGYTGRVRCAQWVPLRSDA